MGVLFGETSTTLKKLGTGSAVAKGENSQGWKVQLGSGNKVGDHDDGSTVGDG